MEGKKMKKYCVDFWINGVHRHWIRFATDIYACHESAKQAIYNEYNVVVGVNASLLCSQIEQEG
jgi:hypothetical protein